VVGHPSALLGRRFPGREVEAGINLERVTADDRAPDALGDRDRRCRLADPGGADDDEEG
jgi:hypothetical protein